ETGGAGRGRRERRGGGVVESPAAPNRHKLRIQSKKLRYAAEFFATLFTTKRAVKRRKQFLSALECLQDGLGDLNDISVHAKRLAAMGIRHRRAKPSRVFAAGLLTGREDARMEVAMTATTRSYADLVKVKPFWR